MCDVSRALNRSAIEIVKFFGYYTSTQTIYDEKTQRGVLNGIHTVQTLQSNLAIYIHEFVLCKTCELPETQYMKKHKCLVQYCLACGKQSPLDMSHKLIKIIESNPANITSFKPDKPINHTIKLESNANTTFAKFKTYLDDFQVWWNQHQNDLTLIESEFSSSSFPIILFVCCLFCESNTILVNIQNYKPYMVMFNRQFDILDAFAFTYIYREFSFEQFVITCKQLYDYDIIEEDTFLVWFQEREPKNKYLKRFLTECNELKDRLLPFITWLQNAEEEEL